MPHAMVEIQPGPPERQSRQCIDLRTGRSFGKHSPRDRDMPFENPGEAIAHEARRPANRDRAGDVRRPVFVLRAAVDKEDPSLDSAI